MNTLMWRVNPFHLSQLCSMKDLGQTYKASARAEVDPKTGEGNVER
jgi:hypothetical protein